MSDYDSLDPRVAREHAVWHLAEAMSGEGITEKQTACMVAVCLLFADDTGDSPANVFAQLHNEAVVLLHDVGIGIPAEWLDVEAFGFGNV